MAPRRSSIDINPLFSRPGEATERPRFALADDAMLPETAYQIVHDEAMLDGNARTEPRHVRRHLDGPGAGPRCTPRRSTRT